MNLKDLLKKQTSQRKLRLFAVACCHQISHLLKDVRAFNALEASENYADEQMSIRKLSNAHNELDALSHKIYDSIVIDEGHNKAYKTVCPVNAVIFASRTPPYNADSAIYCTGYCVDATSWRQRKIQRQIAEDIFHIHNAIVPTSPSIQAIAQSIYEDKRWSDMPILADALEDNNCSDQQVLDHLRSNQLHVRGCWVLDLILNKK